MTRFHFNHPHTIHTIQHTIHTIQHTAVFWHCYRISISISVVLPFTFMSLHACTHTYLYTMELFLHAWLKTRKIIMLSPRRLSIYRDPCCHTHAYLHVDQSACMAAMITSFQFEFNQFHGACMWVALEMQVTVCS